jgi:hypothetical protein
MTTAVSVPCAGSASRTFGAAPMCLTKYGRRFRRIVLGRLDSLFSGGKDMIQTHTSLDPAELQRASADLGARGKTAVTVPCDVSDRRQVETMVEAVARELSVSRACSSEPRWLDPLFRRCRVRHQERSGPLRSPGRACKSCGVSAKLGSLMPPPLPGPPSK